MHTQGVIHGDLKASNILVSDSVVPRALLCDFGLTREAVDVTVAWLEGAGALQWQGPELLVASGSPGKTYATDMWALGMTIYEVRVRRLHLCDQILMPSSRSLAGRLLLRNGLRRVGRFSK